MLLTAVKLAPALAMGNTVVIKASELAPVTLLEFAKLVGYIFGYMTGGVDASSLNVIYNAADFLNKIAFGLIIWAAAMQQPGRAK